MERRECDVFGNNCNSGIRPATYGASVAIVVLFILFAGCFILRRRRRIRRELFNTTSLRPAAPVHSTPGHPHIYQPPPPFEPAPPYEPPKPPPPSHTPPHDTSVPPAPPPPAPPPPAPIVQYPPPSYSPA